MQYGKHTALACGALLSAVFLLLSPVVGQTQARYENTVSWKGVYQAQEPKLRSNFLAEGGRTVLLKDWQVSTTSYRTVGIQLATDGFASGGTLHCEVNSDLISAKVDEDRYDISKTKSHATLTLMAAPQAQQLTESTVVTIRVSWIPDGRESGQPIEWADFVVTLLPGTQNPAPSEQAVGSDAGGTLEMDCPKSVAVGEKLAVRLTLPQGTEKVILNFDGGNFPENTCYRTEDGQEVVLAEEMFITIPAEGQQEMLVVLDFSWTMDRQSSFFLSAAAYAGSRELSAANVKVSTDRAPLEVETDSAAIVMGANAQVTLRIYGDLDGFAWTLEQLTREEEKAVYKASDALTIQTANMQSGTENAQLVISNYNTHAPAGTYRLTVQRIQNGVVLSSFEIPVFIGY